MRTRAISHRPSAISRERVPSIRLLAQDFRLQTQDPLARRAFTLIEIVVVISVILVLAALTLSVSVAVVKGSEVRQTETTIRLLQQALREWELQADRTISYGDGGGFDLDWNTLDEPTEPTEALLMVIGKSEPVRRILAQIDPDFTEVTEENHDFAPGVTSRVLRIYDAWGAPIVAVFPGRPWIQGDIGTPDPDGTIRTAAETECGVAPNRQIMFVSPGPDAEFGNLTMQPDTPEFKLTIDNLYSEKIR